MTDYQNIRKLLKKQTWIPIPADSILWWINANHHGKDKKILENKKQSNLNKIKKNKEKIKKYYEKYSNQKKIKKTETKRRKQKDKVTEIIRENKRLRAENIKLQKQIDEYEDYDERISEIFKQDTIKKAKKQFNILYNQKKTFTWWNSKIFSSFKKRSWFSIVTHWKWNDSQNQQLVGIIFQNSISKKVQE